MSLFWSIALARAKSELPSLRYYQSKKRHLLSKNFLVLLLCSLLHRSCQFATTPQGLKKAAQVVSGQNPEV